MRDDMSESELDETPMTEPRTGLTRSLIGIIAVAVLAICVAGGFAWGSSSAPTAQAYRPTSSSVDAGFARDMSTHHQQAITMATYTATNSTDPAVANLAYDIESSQTIQLGEMTGWLDTWGLSRTSTTPMSWMGHGMSSMVVNGLMPGMATPTQMTKLTTSHGKALDILFLQLMIHHHQGGLQMEQYADQHATLSYVRQLAGNMLGNQGTEIVQMEQMLRQLGGVPLPPPTG